MISSSCLEAELACVNAVHRHVSRHYRQVSNVTESINEIRFHACGSMSGRLKVSKCPAMCPMLLKTKENVLFSPFTGLRKKESTKERKKAGNLSFKRFPYPVERSRTTPFETATSGGNMPEVRRREWAA